MRREYPGQCYKRYAKETGKSYIHKYPPEDSEQKDAHHLHAGAERGLQIGTAVEKEGSLSGCTFSESVTWGKYRSADEQKLVQIWGEYSIVFPLLAAYVLDSCKPRPPKNIVSHMPAYIAKLEAANAIGR